MNRRFCTRLLVVAAVVPTAAAAPRTASAQAGELDGVTRARAATLFKKGERAFRQHEYEKAARAFEEANEVAPHPAPLFNAAAAWEKAGNLVRAANLCAMYLRDAPSDDRRQSKARALLAELTPKVGRIVLEADGGVNPEIDGRAVELDVTYVDAGDHEVSAEFDGEVIEREVEVVAGSRSVVRLSPVPLDDEDEESSERVGSSDDPKRDEKPSFKLAPGWFWAGAAATGVLGGVAIWSGLDTSSARKDYDDNPTSGGLEDGLSKQRRTNVLIGATAVVGVSTVVVGGFLTDWSVGGDEDEVSVLVGPGSVTMRGTF